MANEKILWPQGKASAAMISINLDAEFYGRIFYPGTSLEDGDILRLGRSGMEFGLPRLLNVFDDFGVKATFFIPGEVAVRYPKEVKMIADRGHEIGCHGLEHELLAHLTREEQKERLAKAKAILEETTGKTVTGFRMPEGEITEETLQVVKELGFTYSSSLSDSDVPYVRPSADLMELPIHWALFDLPFFTFAFDPPIPPGQARSASMDEVLKNWRYELEGSRRWGTLLNLQLDPQTAGEQGRVFMVEELLRDMQAAGDVWIATGAEIAAHCAGAE